LPKQLSIVFEKNNIKPAIYPKVDLIKANENENWQVRATTCNLPEIILGDYKNKIIEKAKTDAIWTPKKGKPDKNKQELTREEKEQIVIKTLLDNISVKIPELLINEEVNSRLSKLIQSIEKLGLNLENYLTSIGKTAETT